MLMKLMIERSVTIVIHNVPPPPPPQASVSTPHVGPGGATLAYRRRDRHSGTLYTVYYNPFRTKDLLHCHILTATPSL
jgi:hypothetical protein